MPYKPRAKKATKPKRAYRKRAGAGGPNNLTALARTNYARCSETRQASDPIGLLTNTVYAYQVSMAGASDNSSRRVLGIAKEYQEFRITKIQARLKPYFDSFVATAAGSYSASPQLYMYVVRDGDVPNGLVHLRLMGINPQPFSKDGNKTLTWKPTVVYASETGSPNIIKTSPWMNTSKTNTAGSASTWAGNDTPHYGLIVYCDHPSTSNSGGNDPIPIGQLELEVFYEFRRPFITPAGAGETTTLSQVVKL
ncbi:MAG: putative cap protein [Cressdnaviricota sp.]|nr:MAG: putative cap protein [Cressdnaviricota sp.]